MIAADAPRPADDVPVESPHIISIDITHLVRAALDAQVD